MNKRLTVSELIEELKKFPGDSLALVNNHEIGYNSIRTTSIKNVKVQLTEYEYGSMLGEYDDESEYPTAEEYEKETIQAVLIERYSN